MNTAWDLTRRFPDEYSDWREEAHNGETLLGFEQWLKVLHPVRYRSS
jgi:hypothetical protein